jgi:hypothetical protein
VGTECEAPASDAPERDVGVLVADTSTLPFGMLHVIKSEGAVAGSFNLAGSGVGNPCAMFHCNVVGAPLPGSRSDGGVAGSYKYAGSGVGAPSGMFHCKVVGDVGPGFFNDGGVAGLFSDAGSGVGAPGATFHTNGARPPLPGFSSEGGVAGSRNLAGSGVGLPYGIFHAKVLGALFEGVEAGEEEAEPVPPGLSAGLGTRSAICGTLCTTASIVGTGTPT